MAIKLNCGCIKMALPNGRVVDILTQVLDEISKWLQVETDAPECSCTVRKQATENKR